MGAGIRREDALRFSFLLATPVILAAGVLKLPDLFGPLGDGVRPQVLVGSLLAGLGAYVSVRWLTRWVHTNSLRPFGWYCLAAGARLPGPLRRALRPGTVVTHSKRHDAPGAPRGRFVPCTMYQGRSGASPVGV